MASTSLPVSGAVAQVLADERRDRLGEGDLLDLGDHGEELDHVVRALRREQRDAQAEAALALHVDGQQVRPRGHRHPHLAAAQRGVADVRGEGGEHAARHAAVAVGLARAEDRVGLVHHHDHRAERADGHEDARLLALGVADPFGAEIADLHDRQAALAGEAIDEEGLAHADAARHEDAALEHVGLVVLDEPGQLAELLSWRRCAWPRGRGVTPGFGSLKRTKPWQIFLDEPLLARGDVLGGHPRAVAHGLGQEMLDAQQVQPGGAGGEVLGGEIAPLGQRPVPGQVFGPSRIAGSAGAPRRPAGRCGPAPRAGSAAGRPGVRPPTR